MKQEYIFLHHCGYNHSFYTVNKGHKDKGYPKSKLGWNIGYQYYIRNGKIYRGREENEEGMHNRGYNQNSIAICFDKNHETTPLSNQDKKVAEKLIKEIQKRHNIPNSKILGHRETDNTICPGKYVMEFLNEYRKTTPSTTETPKTPHKPNMGELGLLQTQLNTIKAVLINLTKKLKEYVNNKKNT